MSEIGDVPQPYSINTNINNNIENNDNNNGSSTITESDGVRFMHLFTNKQTGEQVDMIWVEPNHVVPIHPTNNGGGEELLIIDGSLRIPEQLVQIQQQQEHEHEQDVTSSNDSNYNDNEIEYTKWGWLRFPPTYNNNEEDTSNNNDYSKIIQHNRSQIRSGPDGVQLYRKTGHLTSKALSMEKIQIEE
jgi:hypothetical protein